MFILFLTNRYNKRKELFDSMKGEDMEHVHQMRAFLRSYQLKKVERVQGRGGEGSSGGKGGKDSLLLSRETLLWKKQFLPLRLLLIEWQRGLYKISQFTKEHLILQQRGRRVGDHIHFAKRVAEKRSSFFGLHLGELFYALFAQINQKRSFFVLQIEKMREYAQESVRRWRECKKWIYERISCARQRALLFEEMKSLGEEIREKRQELCHCRQKVESICLFWKEQIYHYLSLPTERFYHLRRELYDLCKSLGALFNVQRSA